MSNQVYIIFHRDFDSIKKVYLNQKYAEGFITRRYKRKYKEYLNEFEWRISNKRNNDLGIDIREILDKFGTTSLFLKVTKEGISAIKEPVPFNYFIKINHPLYRLNLFYLKKYNVSGKSNEEEENE